MKVSDQSANLAKMREGHRDQLTKLKDSFSSQIKNIKETNEVLREEMRENYSQEKASLIKENEDKIDVISKKVGKLLDERREKYKDSSLEQREDFRKERIKLTKGFQDKLVNIKNSYDEAIEQHKYLGDQQLRNTEENFSKKLDIKEKNSNKLIGEIQDKSKETVGELQNELSVQKKKMVTAHRKDMDLQAKESSADLRSQRERSHKRLEEVITNRDSEIEKMNEKFEFALGRSRSDDRAEIDRITATFEDSVNRMSRASQRDYKKLQENFTKERSDLMRDKQQEVYAVNREKEEIVDRALRGEGVEFQKQELRDSYESRLEGMNELMFDQRIKFEKDLKDMDQHVKAQVNEKSFIERKNIDRQKEIFNTSLNQNIQRTRREQVDLEKGYTRKLRNSEAKHEEKVLRDSKHFNNLLHRQREFFGENVRKLEESNIENVKNLQHEYSIEKKQISDINHKRIEETMKNQREEFNRKVDKLVESYEQKYLNVTSAHEKTKDLSQAKIERLQKNSKMKQRAEAQFYQEMRKSQQEEMKAKVSDMQKDFDRTIKELKFTFDSEVSKIRRENDVHNTKLIQKYEEEKQSMIFTHQQELRKKMHAAESRLQSVIKDSKYQQNRMVEGYEKQIKDLKRAYEIERITQYNSAKA